MGINAVLGFVQQATQQVSEDSSATRTQSPTKVADSQVVNLDGGTPPPTSTAPAPPPKPSADAKDCGASGSEYAIDKALADLNADPAYREKWEWQEGLGALQSEFAELEAKWGKGGADGLMSWDDIKWAALNRDRGTSSGALKLADFLYANHELFKSIDGDGDGLISLSEIKGRMRSLQKEMHELEKTAKDAAGAKTEEKKTDDKKTGNGGSSGTTPPGENPLELTPFVSDKTEPMERTTDAISHMQGEIDRLTIELTKTTDPGKLKAIEAQITKATMVMQTLMSSMQQMQQLMSNIAKMWSDMAMAAIRNTH